MAAGPVAWAWVLAGTAVATKHGVSGFCGQRTRPRARGDQVASWGRSRPGPWRQHSLPRLWCGAKGLPSAEGPGWGGVAQVRKMRCGVPQGRAGRVASCGLSADLRPPFPHGMMGAQLGAVSEPNFKMGFCAWEPPRLRHHPLRPRRRGPHGPQQPSLPARAARASWCPRCQLCTCRPCREQCPLNHRPAPPQSCTVPRLGLGLSALRRPWQSGGSQGSRSSPGGPGLPAAVLGQGCVHHHGQHALPAGLAGPGGIPPLVPHTEAQGPGVRSRGWGGGFHVKKSPEASHPCARGPRSLPAGPPPGASWCISNEGLLTQLLRSTDMGPVCPCLGPRC